MKRLYLTVEGQTEAEFAVGTLQPHLTAFGVNLLRPRFTGPHSRRGGRIPQGGMFHTFRHVLTDIERWMRGDKSPDARFSMMVDLYHLPHDFPGYAEGMAKADPWDQATILQEALAGVLVDSRFIPYLQVHEFEALVLAAPLRLKELYEGRDAEIERLAQECDAFPSPEKINHGQHSHPKFRIKAVVSEYQENVAGPLIAESIGLEALRATCPHFDSWLTRLEQLDADSASTAIDPGPSEF